MHHSEFNDPRLVAVYDTECPWSRDDDFFVAVADETPGARVLDLGCGTGRLALGLSTHGHSVTGVDPARASLDAARAKPGAEFVTWIEGTSGVLGANEFDLAIMTSHVAQFFLTDDEWTRTLADVHRSLAPGGRLVFDTRDPDARAWERWSTDRRRSVTLPDGRVVQEWTEVTAVEHDAVSFAIHYEFPDHGELVSTATLRFRSADELSESLRAASFTVEQIYGGWNREPIGHGDGEFLVIGRADPRKTCFAPPKRR